VKSLLSILLLSLISACAAQDTPIVRFCGAALSFGTQPTSSTIERCQCADGLAQRRLDPQSYRLLNDAAAAWLRERSPMAAVGDAAQVAKMNPVEKAATAADLASVVLKAASRCAGPSSYTDTD
jgi:hypothetical protein